MRVRDVLRQFLPGPPLQQIPLDDEIKAHTRRRIREINRRIVSIEADLRVVQASHQRELEEK